jgi:hypothetical protein
MTTMPDEIFDKGCGFYEIPPKTQLQHCRCFVHMVYLDLLNAHEICIAIDQLWEAHRQIDKDITLHQTIESLLQYCEQQLSAKEYFTSEYTTFLYRMMAFVKFTPFE